MRASKRRNPIWRSSTRGRAEDLKTKVGSIDLEAGRPAAGTAIIKLENELKGARLRGVKVLRVIHGYGSSGQGGKIKRHVAGILPDLATRGLITSFIHGEDYTMFSVAGQELRSKYPELERHYRGDEGNPGITIVTL